MDYLYILICLMFLQQLKFDFMSVQRKLTESKKSNTTFPNCLKYSTRTLLHNIVDFIVIEALQLQWVLVKYIR